jgi:glycosyltransferase involved in cell wall biosynthesis
VGQLIYQKGLDVLIQALAMTHAESCFLHIIGNGSEETSYENLAKRQQVDPFIQWHGTMPNEQVLDHMAKADLLVLPSRYDGWGAVVNEALTVGTPVLASDACGASCLLTSDFLGDVFPSGNTSKLAAVLKKRTARGPLPIEERTKIREWAGRSIAPEAVAGYLMEILCRAKSQKSFDGLRPPWERGSPQGSWRNS